MVLQHLRYLVALARDRHFARAAETCGVAQPTLSEGIRQLEDDLGIPIVDRRQRYQGLTPAGTRVLMWANRIIADYESLAQEVAELRDGLVGRLTLAVIPAMHPVVPLLTTPLVDAHPKVTVMVLSQTSVEIQRSLDDFTADAGLTYLDNEPLERVKTQALYREHYVLVTQADGPFGQRTEVTWKEAATLRLVLLASAMQNRRILDGIFREAGATPRAPVEAMSLLTVCAHIALGGWATILPHTFGPLVAPLPNTVVLPLVEPTVERTIGLAVAKRDPLPPVARALLEIAKAVRIDAVFSGSARR
jgi:DNA-binding transcriptional LysR family regulator